MHLNQRNLSHRLYRCIYCLRLPDVLGQVVQGYMGEMRKRILFMNGRASVILDHDNLASYRHPSISLTRSDKIAILASWTVQQ